MDDEEIKVLLSSRLGPNSFAFDSFIKNGNAGIDLLYSLCTSAISTKFYNDTQAMNINPGEGKLALLQGLCGNIENCIAKISPPVAIGDNISSIDTTPSNNHHHHYLGLVPLLTASLWELTKPSLFQQVSMKYFLQGYNDIVLVPTNEVYTVLHSLLYATVVQIFQKDDNFKIVFNQKKGVPNNNNGNSSTSLSTLIQQMEDIVTKNTNDLPFTQRTALRELLHLLKNISNLLQSPSPMIIRFNDNEMQYSLQFLRLVFRVYQRTVTKLTEDSINQYDNRNDNTNISSNNSSGNSKNKSKNKYKSTKGSSSTTNEENTKFLSTPFISIPVTISSISKEDLPVWWNTTATTTTLMDVFYHRFFSTFQQCLYNNPSFNDTNEEHSSFIYGIIHEYKEFIDQWLRYTVHYVKTSASLRLQEWKLSSSSTLLTFSIVGSSVSSRNDPSSDFSRIIQNQEYRIHYLSRLLFTKLADISLDHSLALARIGIPSLPINQFLQLIQTYFLTQGAFIQEDNNVENSSKGTVGKSSASPNNKPSPANNGNSEGKPKSSGSLSNVASTSSDNDGTWIENHLSSLLPTTKATVFKTLTNSPVLIMLFIDTVLLNVETKQRFGYNSNEIFTSYHDVYYWFCLHYLRYIHTPFHSTSTTDVLITIPIPVSSALQKLLDTWSRQLQFDNGTIQDYSLPNWYCYDLQVRQSLDTVSDLRDVYNTVHASLLQIPINILREEEQKQKDIADKANAAATKVAQIGAPTTTPKPATPATKGNNKKQVATPTNAVPPPPPPLPSPAVASSSNSLPIIPVIPPAPIVVSLTHIQNKIQEEFNRHWSTKYTSLPTPLPYPIPDSNEDTIDTNNGTGITITPKIIVTKDLTMPTPTSPAKGVTSQTSSSSSLSTTATVISTNAKQRKVNSGKYGDSLVGSFLNTLPSEIVSKIPEMPVLKTSRPNYFLSLRLNDPHLRATVAQLQAQILEKYPQLLPCKIPVEDLHITITVLVLKDGDAIKKAKETLQACEIHSRTLYPVSGSSNSVQPMLVSSSSSDTLPSDTSNPYPHYLTVQGLDTFRNNVLFAKPAVDNHFARFIELANRLHTAFYHAGLTQDSIDKENKILYQQAIQQWIDNVMNILTDTTHRMTFSALSSTLRNNSVNRGTGSNPTSARSSPDNTTDQLTEPLDLSNSLPKHSKSSNGKREEVTVVTEGAKDDDEEEEEEEEIIVGEDIDEDFNEDIMVNLLSSTGTGLPTVPKGSLPRLIRRDYHPHITLFKLSKVTSKRGKRIKSIPKDSWNSYADNYFGTSPIFTVELSEMARRDKTDGYYYCHERLVIQSSSNTTSNSKQMVNKDASKVPVTVDGVSWEEI